jgi:hypothetical protein
MWYNRRKCRIEQVLADGMDSERKESAASVLFKQARRADNDYC